MKKHFFKHLSAILTALCLTFSISIMPAYTETSTTDHLYVESTDSDKLLASDDDPEAMY